MIRAYTLESDRCVETAGVPDPDAASGPILWIDLLQPTREEEQQVETLLGLDIPTPEEMAEIETSSRLYRDGDASFMTARLILNAGADRPDSTDTTLVLTPRALVSVRHAEPAPFGSFVAQITRRRGGGTDPESVFVGLLDAIVDRIADILEDTGARLDDLSHEIFAPGQGSREFRGSLRTLGRCGDVISKSRESLTTLVRLASFAAGVPQIARHDEALQGVRLLEQDLHALIDHASFLSGKTTFLLDATLGMISIEQNAIIKIFSVAAVILLPPTLIASIYGMNFVHMPEIHWVFGYPLALVAMVASMVAAWAFFKRRGWM